MLARSHLALGVLGAFVAHELLPLTSLNITSEIYYTMFMPFILLGAILPDIDEPRSLIGRKLPLISHIVSLSFSHRGFTHFLIFPLIIEMFGILLLLSGYNNLAFCVFALGYGVFLHQIGDMLTISGIPYYFFPLSNAKGVLLPRSMRFPTGGLREKIILTAFLIPTICIIGMEAINITNIDLKTIQTILGELSLK